MIGLTSKVAGVLLLPKTDTKEYTILDLVEGKEHSPIEAQYLYSAAQDWVEIESGDTKTLLETATNEYWLERAVSLIRLAIGGLEITLEKEVLEHVEELISTLRVSSEKVLDRLLVAPLLNCGLLQKLTKNALSNGFSAVASLLDEMNDLQPLLKRLTNLWLDLDDSAFASFSESREKIWVTVVERSIIRKILTAGNNGSFLSEWNCLAWYFQSPKSRSGVSILGQELSHFLFPQAKPEGVSVPLNKETPIASHIQTESDLKAEDALVRVKKQIAAIAQVVSMGNDSKAKKFLRELIQEQTSFSGGESHAVKSLCNIAQRCADMFRVDFEAECLSKSLELDPNDTWTQIQYGDHLKRIGDYSSALTILTKAMKSSESEVAQSSIADVYSQQGDYDRAIQIYKNTQNWNDKPEVLTAIADNLRKWGRIDDAEVAYKNIIGSGQPSIYITSGNRIRAHVGLAEISKKRGKLGDAVRTYKWVIAQNNILDTDMIFYKLGLCNVLKIDGKFSDAFSIVNEIIQQFPFSMEARFTRGSILGLIGKEDKGLEDLPESSGSRSWREWLRRYYRGLLLLKLDRYGDAKKDLVEELSKAIVSGEDQSFLRMAAALWYLGKKDIPEAERILSLIPNLYDCRAAYLSLVLNLHLATLKNDQTTVATLMHKIDSIGRNDMLLYPVVKAITKCDFGLAIKMETDVLLMLAA
jgi:tetratricopeptide (TPR) repeat protein